MVSESEHYRKHDTSELDYQPVRNNFRAVILTVAATFLLLLLAQILLWWPTHHHVGKLVVKTHPSIPQLPDGDVIFAGQEKNLSTYDWVDHRAGIARIPIERAMQLLAENPGKSFLAGTPAARERPAHE
jgi:hypothetical protein